MLVSKVLVQNYEIYDRLLLGQTSFLIGILLYSKENEIKTNYDSDIIYWVSTAHVSSFSSLRHFLYNVKNIGWYCIICSQGIFTEQYEGYTNQKLDCHTSRNLWRPYMVYFDYINFMFNFHKINESRLR